MLIRSNKIFETYGKNFKNNINFLKIDECTLQSEKLQQFICTAPMNSNKKFIFLTSTNLRDNDKIFYDNFLKFLFTFENKL